MPFVDDIFSLMRKGRNLTKDFEDIANMNTQSIAKRAQASTCQFPCFIPDSVPLAMGSAITKNMDRVYASFVQSVIASNPLIDITIDRSPLDYMKRLHQNLKLESVIDEEALFERYTNAKDLRSFMESECPDLIVPDHLYEETVDKIYKGEYKLFLDPTGSYGVAFKEAAIPSETIQKHIKSLNEHMSSFNLTPFSTTKENNGSVKKSDIIQGILKNQPNTMGPITDKLSTPRLVDRDAKRVNELQPYGLSVRLMAVNDKKEFVQYIDFIVGIKAIMHVMKSRDAVTNVGNVLKNKNAMFNFVRWTTGEISFVKDLLLHLDDLKFDAAGMRGSSSPFPVLRRLKEKRFKLTSGGPIKLVPNATFVLSSYEVDDIKKEYGYDVRDVFFAKKFMNELFLMAFIIVDEGSETIDILYDGSSSFETYTLETLEKEIDMSSNKLGKEIGRMISR